MKEKKIQIWIDSQFIAVVDDKTADANISDAKAMGYTYQDKRHRHIGIITIRTKGGRDG